MKRSLLGLAMTLFSISAFGEIIPGKYKGCENAYFTDVQILKVQNVLHFQAMVPVIKDEETGTFERAQVHGTIATQTSPSGAYRLSDGQLTVIYNKDFTGSFTCTYPYFVAIYPKGKQISLMGSGPTNLITKALGCPWPQTFEEYNRTQVRGPYTLEKLMTSGHSTADNCEESQVGKACGQEIQTPLGRTRGICGFDPIRSTPDHSVYTCLYGN